MATALKATRVATGWSQTEVIARMRGAAAGVGEQLPGAETMRGMLCHWENGRRRPGEFYRRVFCAVYHRSPEQLGFPSPHGAGTGVVASGVVAALLYAAPLTTAQLWRVPPARVRLYTTVALADPRSPSAQALAAGLRQAQADQPPWLDRDRLRACQGAAERAATSPDTPLDATGGSVPDWVTTGRVVGSAIAATVFTTHPG